MASSSAYTSVPTDAEKADEFDLEGKAPGLDPAHEGQLPPPNTAPQQQVQTEKKKYLPGWMIIAIWIFFSGSVIIYNKWILDEDGLDFPYPIWLTTWHLFTGTVLTRLLYWTTKHHHLLDGVDKVELPWSLWVRSILPIGALFSGSLIFSNFAYLSLSVSFIQMLKAFTAVAVLLMSVVSGLQSFDKRKLVLVSCISGGVALASYGEIDFALSGFICQALGIFFEASRLTAIEKILHGMKMDPLVSLYYYAPVCATLNFCIGMAYEGFAPYNLAMPQLGPLILGSNASVAFGLNVAVVFLIGAASSLVLTLSGVLKDILLVVGSVLLMGSAVTWLQMFGYSIALVGLFVFKTKPEVMAEYVDNVKRMVGLGGR